MADFRRNIKFYQRVQYGFYQFTDHFFGREKMSKLLQKSRKKFYKNLAETLQKSGEGKILPIERRKNISLKEFKKHYVRKGIPVVLEGAAAEWDCVKKWSLDYFEELHGDDDIVLVRMDKKEYPYENIKLSDVINNIREGGKKYYRFYPLLERHPEHLKDVDYKWLLERNNRLTWFDAFQVFFGGKGTHTKLHNANQCNLFVQAYGEKKWILYSHYYTMIIDPNPVKNIYRQTPERDRGQFNPFEPDYNYPYDLFKYIDGYEVHLKPGDVLWNPPFYWHSVTNTTDSIGMGYRWLSPLYAFKISPLYMFLDLFATNPPFWKASKLSKKDANLVHIAEYGNLDKYIEEMKKKGVKIN